MSMVELAVWRSGGGAGFRGLNSQSGSAATRQLPAEETSAWRRPEPQLLYLDRTHLLTFIVRDIKMERLIMLNIKMKH